MLPSHPLRSALLLPMKERSLLSLLAAAVGSTLARIGSQFVPLVKQPFVRLRSAAAVPGVPRSCRGAAAFSMDMQPNVEVTGATRQDGRAVRPMMELGGRTARLVCRGASG